MASIRKRDADSGPRYDVTFREPLTQRQRRRTFAKRADAQRFAHTVEADKLRGTYVDTRNPTTVAEYARLWAASRPHRASTAERVESTIRSHIEGTQLGRRRVVDVRKSEVQAWVLDRADVLAPSTLRLTTKLLRSVFLDAVHEGVIARSPAARIDLPQDDRRVERRRLVRASDERVAPLSTEQVHHLADAMSDRHRALIVAQAGLGLRVGELLALRVVDVDFLRREVAITEQLQPRSRERVSLKTKRSRRTVPLPIVVAQALSQHIATYPPGPDGSIFTGETSGRPYSREVYSRAIARGVTKLGLPAGTSSHDLRHHYVSVLLDAGESVVTVAERIGDTAAMILDVYGHMMPNTEERTRRAVDDAWGRISAEAVAATDE